MANQPLGNLDNPNVLGRFKQYSRPSAYVQRPKLNLSNDVTNQLNMMNQNNIDSIQAPITQNMPRPSVLRSENHINNVSNKTLNTHLQSKQHPHIQPTILQSEESRIYTDLQPQFIQKTLSQPQQQNLRESSYTNQQYQSEEATILVSQKVESDKQFEDTVLSQTQDSLFVKNYAAPIYLNNYNGEYEDKKVRKFSRKSLSFNKGPLILASSVMVTILLAGGFVVFMNWNNNKNVVQAQSSTSINSNQNSDSSNPINFASSVEPTASQVSNYTVGPTIPKYLIIPKINVTSMITPVNLNSKNFLESPSNIFNVGWWQSSSLPGQQGSTVLDGFTTNGSNYGVFNSLQKITPGDKILIQKGDNTKISYTVVKSTEFGTNNLTMDQAISPIDTKKPGLNIITCSMQSSTCPSTLNGDFVVFATEDK